MSQYPSLDEELAALRRSLNPMAWYGPSKCRACPVYFPLGDPPVLAFCGQPVRPGEPRPDAGDGAFLIGKLWYPDEKCPKETFEWHAQAAAKDDNSPGS